MGISDREFFPKFLPSDIMASIGLAQLRKLDALQAYRKQIWELYQKELESLGCWTSLKTLRRMNNIRISAILFASTTAGEDRFAKYLYAKGSIQHSVIIHSTMNPIYQSKARLPNCERLNEEGLNIPLHPNLSSSDIDCVISTIKAFA